MSESRIIRIVDPGTTNFYKVFLSETSRNEATPENRVSDIATSIIQFAEGSAFSEADARTVADDAAAAMKLAGYI